MYQNLILNKAGMAQVQPKKKKNRLVYNSVTQMITDAHRFDPFKMINIDIDSNHTLCNK